MVGEFGKSNTNCVPMGPPPRGADLDNNGSTYKWVGGYFRGIGLVDMIRKFFTSIVNNGLKSAITLNDALHVFRQGWRVGIATLEENLAQKLAGIYHEPLFQVFLDVRKA